MAVPPRSINVNVPWSTLLPLLGVNTPSLALPAAVPCPLCKKGVLSVYEDHVVGGQWFWCERCGRSGDMILLAAKSWGLSIPAAVYRLVNNGFDLATDDRAIQQYSEKYVNYRERLSALWTEARQGTIPGCGTFQRLVHVLNLRCEVSDSRWRDGPGWLFGGIDKDAVERCFAPGSMRCADSQRQRANPSAHRIFRGHGWDDLLVVPFFDLPWRISGFLLIGRDGDPAQDFIFKHTNWGAMGNQHIRESCEAGLALHPRVMETSADWNHAVFALRDPILALRLQTRHFEMSSRPLPLVTWRDDTAEATGNQAGRGNRTTTAWSMLGNRRVVFWMPTFDAATVRQAISRDGMISTVGPDSTDAASLREYAWKQKPLDLIRLVQKTAQPWPQALAEQLGGMPDSGLERFFVRLQADGADYEHILRRCGQAVRQRTATMFGDGRLHRTIKQGGMTISERPEGWYVTGGKYKVPECIVDAILRMDMLIHEPNGQRIFCQGRIIYHGRTVPFTVPLEDIEKDSLEWMTWFLATRAHVCLLYERGWTRKIIQIARQFQPSKVVEGVDRVGWDGRQSRFVFPFFSIYLNGMEDFSPHFIQSENAPGLRLHPPEVLSPEEVQRPEQDPYKGKLFWATTACVLANVLAPACHRPMAGIGLCGIGAHYVGVEVAKALGCAVREVWEAKTARQAIQEEHTHSWPLIVHVGSGVQQRHQRLLLAGDPPDKRNCVMELDWWAARVKSISGGWNLVWGSESAIAEPELLSFARRLMPAYLQDICRRRLNLDHWSNPLASYVAEVLRDLARFVGERGADAETVLAAGEFILPAGQPQAVAFADLVVGLFHEGDLDITAEDDVGDRRRTVIEVPGANELFLAHATLAKALRDKGVEPPEHDQVTHALNEASMLIEDRGDGWVFQRAWIEQRERELYEDAPGLLQTS